MSKYTAFRCPIDLLAAARIKAKLARRSLSNYIITLIEKDVQEELAKMAAEAAEQAAAAPAAAAPVTAKETAAKRKKA